MSFVPKITFNRFHHSPWDPLQSLETLLGRCSPTQNFHKLSALPRFPISSSYDLFVLLKPIKFLEVVL